MADQILKDATKLGSTLAAVASKQLGSVLNELRGPMGEGRLPDPRDGGSLGGLAANVMQIVNQVGSLLTQLSQYDLVRNNANVLLLSSANSISSITVRAGEETTYELLVENNGREGLKFVLLAKLAPDSEQLIHKDELDLQVGERKRVNISLPALKGDKPTLVISALFIAESGEEKILARKTVAINVLQQPRPHSP